MWKCLWWGMLELQHDLAPFGDTKKGSPMKRGHNLGRVYGHSFRYMPPRCILCTLQTCWLCSDKNFKDIRCDIVCDMITIPYLMEDVKAYRKLTRYFAAVMVTGAQI